MKATYKSQPQVQPASAESAILPEDDVSTASQTSAQEEDLTEKYFRQA